MSLIKVLKYCEALVSWFSDYGGNFAICTDCNDHCVMPLCYHYVSNHLKIK